MTEIIERLTQDYEDFSRVLAALEKQIQILADGNTPDIDLMVEIMDYTRNYVNIFVHPREDLIFKRIMVRDEDARPLMEELIREHETELKMSLALAEAIDSAFLVDDLQPRGSLTRLGRDYIELNRRHLDKVKNETLPLANKVLKDKDWKQIAAELPDEKLPKFEELLQQQYRVLYEHMRDTG